jgi:hypothetical protein
MKNRTLYEAILVLFLIGNPLTHQYTVWNCILSLAKPFLNIPLQTMFINSITTWVAFQYGATDHAKYRLMQKGNINSVAKFVLMDILAHYAPMLYWGYMVLRDRKRISYRHIIHQSTWVLLYYVFVGKGLNCEKQYVKYPYMRQVFQTATTPLIMKYVVNRLNEGNIYPLIACLSYVYYGKDYLDICDSIKREQACVSNGSSNSVTSVTSVTEVSNGYEKSKYRIW